VLAEAQALGYAEADPGIDVDGIDTAHKLALLTSLAFGCEVDFPGVHVEGIRHVSATDIAFAEELGYRIKLLGIARPTEHGIEQRVHACMVPIGTPIAHVEGVFNAVVAVGNFVENAVFEGRGAGGGRRRQRWLTSSVSRQAGDATFGVPAAASAPARGADRAAPRQYYVRLTVLDRPASSPTSRPRFATSRFRWRR
jgi:homoserine dehydrogenase